MVHPAHVEMRARERKGAVHVSAKGVMVLLASVKRTSAFVTKTVVPSDGPCKWNTCIMTLYTILYLLLL